MDDKLALSFSVKNKATGATVRGRDLLCFFFPLITTESSQVTPHQVFVRLVNAKNEEIVYATTKAEGESKYQISLVRFLISFFLFSFWPSCGKINLLFFGRHHRTRPRPLNASRESTLLRSSLVIRRSRRCSGRLQRSICPSPRSATRSRTRPTAACPRLAMSSASPPNEPVLSCRSFSLLRLLLRPCSCFFLYVFPLACLISNGYVQWAYVGANVSNFSGSPLQLLFHALIIAIFVLLGWYWISLTVFEFLSYVTPVSIAAIFAGSAVLSHIAKLRS